ncbi:hypothetical protein AALC25_05590 [Lachnospiraceae bacterium 29-84]
MSVENITNTVNTTAAYTAATQKAATPAEKTDTSSKDTATKDSGVVYEKGQTSTNATYSKSDIVARLKKDADTRTAQLRSLVEKMMTSQGNKIGQADSIWRFLASGNYTVSPEVKAQAQADIADDGYWGVEQTSDRIVEFAKALSGGDSEKAAELRAAFEKGFKAATKSWGKELPSISQRTYDAVMEKFDKWEGKTAEEE